MRRRLELSGDFCQEDLPVFGRIPDPDVRCGERALGEERHGNSGGAADVNVEER